MTDAEIKTMASRFLSWCLPDDFSPDGGISFVASYESAGGQVYPRSPTGTNLFTAAQAEAMVRHMLGVTP